MENDPRPARTEFTPRARPRSGPEAETGPRPACPQTTLPVPGRHAARDGNQPCGPLALSASRAPGRNLGLGRESLILPGLNLGPVSVSCSSQANGCVRFPAEQNRARQPHANPSLIPFSSAPSHAPQRSRATPSADERRRRERA
jgi:hypothetical protein